MAGSINKVILVGNLGRDPEIRSTQDGKQVASFSIATSDTWKDKMTGERREKTEWHRIVVFNERLVEIVRNYLKKGMKVYIEGALQTRKWQDNTGAERYTTEIVLQNFQGTLVMLDSRGGEGGASGGGQSYAEETSGGGGYADAGQMQKTAVVEELDDEIPF